MKKYFNYFKTLHDETSPVGQLGRGAHYSIVQSLAWTDLKLIPSSTPLLHNLAIIWDEDHDERIIGVIETLYLRGLLTPVLFAGERKGALSLVLNSDIATNMPDGWLSEYTRKVSSIADNLEDPWGIDVSLFDDSITGIINGDDREVNLYLHTVKMLWRLGLKKL